MPFSGRTDLGIGVRWFRAGFGPGVHVTGWHGRREVRNVRFDVRVRCCRHTQRGSRRGSGCCPCAAIGDGDGVRGRERGSCANHQLPVSRHIEFLGVGGKRPERGPVLAQVEHLHGLGDGTQMLHGGEVVGQGNPSLVDVSLVDSTCAIGQGGVACDRRAACRQPGRGSRLAVVRLGGDAVAANR